VTDQSDDAGGREQQAGGQILSLSEAAALIQRSNKFVSLRASEGYIPKVAKGKYNAIAVVRGVISYYEDKLKEATKAEVAR